MRIIRPIILSALSILSVATTTQAQFEGFTGVPPGSYASFSGFTAPGGIGSFARMGLGGLLVVNNGTMFPTFAGPNAMFGRGVDVQFKLTQPREAFFGHFRALPFIKIPPTSMRIRFYLMSGVWTPWFNHPVNLTGYNTGLWNIMGMFGQRYRAVQMKGNGSLPGYVAMDDLWVL